MTKPLLKIAIIGEGKNDVGIMGTHEWQEGTVQTYLKRFLEDNFELKFFPLATPKSELVKLKTLKGGRYNKNRPKGVAKKLLYFLFYLKKNRITADFNLLVLFSDTDKTYGKRASKTEAKKKYDSVLEQINQGKAFMESKIPELVVVPMVSIRILECWLLGDKEGFEYMGCSPQNPKLPSEPELLWGEHTNPESNYPKHYLKRILENGGFENTTDTYQQIVWNNNLNNLVKNCPMSFAPFAQKIAAFKNDFLHSKT